MKERIERLEKELARLKAELDLDENLTYSRKHIKPTFEIGNWVFVENTGTQISNGNMLIGSQKGNVYRISRLDYDSGKASKRDPRYVSEEGYNYRGKDLRKATPEEIESALIAEAKRRYNVPCVVDFLDTGKSELEGFNLVYNPNNDSLTATGGFDEIDNRIDILYQNGKWADVIENTKFFEWDVEDINSFSIQIGCETYRKKFLEDVIEAISKLDNRTTISELTDELKKLNL